MAVNEKKDMGASVLARLKKQSYDTELSELLTAFCTGRISKKA